MILVVWIVMSICTFCFSEKWKVSDAIACADGSSLCDLPEEVACEPFSCSKLEIPDFIKTVNVGKSLHLNCKFT